MKIAKRTKEIEYDVYITSDGKEFEDKYQAKKHEDQILDNLRKQYNHADLLKQFGELIKNKDVFFGHDDADGFFIKITGQGFNESILKVAELDDLIITKHVVIEGAIHAAIDYLKKNR